MRQITTQKLSSHEPADANRKPAVTPTCGCLSSGRAALSPRPPLHRRRPGRRTPGCDADARPGRSRVRGAGPVVRCSQSRTPQASVLAAEAGVGVLARYRRQLCHAAAGSAASRGVAVPRSSAPLRILKATVPLGSGFPLRRRTST